MEELNVGDLNESNSLDNPIISAMEILHDLNAPYFNEESSVHPSTSRVEACDVHVPIVDGDSSVDPLTGSAPPTDTQKTANLPLLFRDNGVPAADKVTNDLTYASIVADLFQDFELPSNTNDTQETNNVAGATPAGSFRLEDTFPYNSGNGLDFEIPLSYNPYIHCNEVPQPSTSKGESGSLGDLDNYLRRRETDPISWDLEEFIFGHKQDYAPVASGAENLQVLPVTVSNFTEQSQCTTNHNQVTESFGASRNVVNISNLQIITNADLAFLDNSSGAQPVAANGNALDVHNPSIVTQADPPMHTEAISIGTNANLLTETHADLPVQPSISDTQTVATATNGDLGFHTNPPASVSFAVTDIRFDSFKLPIVTDADLRTQSTSSSATVITTTTNGHSDLLTNPPAAVPLVNTNPRDVLNLPIVTDVDIPTQPTSSRAAATTTVIKSDQAFLSNPPAASPFAVNANLVDILNLPIVTAADLPTQSTNSITEATNNLIPAVTSGEIRNTNKRKRTYSRSVNSKRSITAPLSHQGNTQFAAVPSQNSQHASIISDSQRNSCRFGGQFQDRVLDNVPRTGVIDTVSSSQGNSSQPLPPRQVNPVRLLTCYNLPPTSIVQRVPKYVVQFRACPPQFPRNPPSFQDNRPLHQVPAQGLQQPPHYPGHCCRFQPPFQGHRPQQNCAPHQHHCCPLHPSKFHPDPYNNNCPPSGLKPPKKRRKRVVGSSDVKEYRKLRTSGYIEFGREIRQRHERTLSMTEVATMWKNLSAEEKEKYEQRAETIRREYEATLEKFNQS